MERPKLGTVRLPRAPAVAAAPGGLPPGLAGGGQAMPMMPGHVILTEREKVGLRQLGWKDGDPIPGNMAALYAGVQAAQTDAATLPEMNLTGYVPVEVPQAVDIRTLPRAKQEEMQQALEDAKVQARMFTRQQTSQVEGAGPGVNEAIAAGLQTPFVDAPPRSAAAPEPRPPADPDGAGGAALPVACAHCGWKYALPDEIEATPDDKLRWVVAQEGGHRFEKDYRLFDGRIVVTFRSLTSKESDLAFRQVAVDGTRAVRERAPEPEDAYWRNLMTYRLVLGIARLWTATQAAVDNPPLDEWTVEAGAYPAPNTKVYAVVGPVTEAMFPHENIRRVVGNAFHRFQLLIEKLEAHADDDPFWTGIGQ